MLAGHTWVILATAVRKNTARASQFYRVQRPNNSVLPDMQEGVLQQVIASKPKAVMLNPKSPHLCECVSSVSSVSVHVHRYLRVHPVCIYYLALSSTRIFAYFALR